MLLEFLLPSCCCCGRGCSCDANCAVGGLRQEDLAFRLVRLENPPPVVAAVDVALSLLL